MRNIIQDLIESEDDNDLDGLQVVDDLPPMPVDEPVKKRKVKKQSVAVGRQSATILRVLPANNALLEVQTCERLRAKLSVAACAARWEKANADGRVDYVACRGCKVGERNAMGSVVDSTIEEAFGEPVDDVPSFCLTQSQADALHFEVAGELLCPPGCDGHAQTEGESLLVTACARPEGNV